MLPGFGFDGIITFFPCWRASKRQHPLFATYIFLNNKERAETHIKVTQCFN